MSYRAEVQADSTGTWAGNGLTFATWIEASDYVKDLEWRWTSVKAIRVVEGEWPVTHRFDHDSSKVEALS